MKIYYRVDTKYERFHGNLNYDKLDSSGWVGGLDSKSCYQLFVIIKELSGCEVQLET